MAISGQAAAALVLAALGLFLGICLAVTAFIVSRLNKAAQAEWGAALRSGRWQAPPDRVPFLPMLGMVFVWATTALAVLIMAIALMV
jgi:hypothetical protein